jgi:hypothetical protein
MDQAVAGGVVAGMIGGAVLAAVMMFLTVHGGGDVWMAMKGASAPILGARAHEPGFDLLAVGMGLALHYAISVGWGVVFAMTMFGLSKPMTVLAGAGWGLLVWMAMYYVALPVVGLAETARATPVSMAIFTHLIFGLAVGLGFLPFQQRKLHIARRRYHRYA